MDSPDDVLARCPIPVDDLPSTPELVTLEGGARTNPDDAWWRIDDRVFFAPAGSLVFLSFGELDLGTFDG